ncbi:MAG: 5-oxoprolinase subunit PxpB [Candidatus Limnocylindrales bacterium]
MPFGDRALMVELAGSADLEPGLDADRRANAIAEAIRADVDGPWGCPVPAYDTVLVTFSPLVTSGEAAAARLAALADAAAIVEPAAGVEGELLEIPVRYGGSDGPDLDDVAERVGLRPEEVIAAHAAGRYRAFFLGFAPGFAYLGSLPESLAVPRRASPRTRVPAGSVAIAGVQTAVYPRDMPGGWNLIGRTDLVVWDPRRDPPALLRPGAVVRFVPVRG